MPAMDVRLIRPGWAFFGQTLTATNTLPRSSQTKTRIAVSTPKMTTRLSASRISALRL